MEEVTDERARVEGVRYTKVKRYRPEVTVIDGHAETRQVPYDVWVPRARRDMDAVILRAVIVAAMVTTALAVFGATAGIGGLLAPLISHRIAYGIAVVFDVMLLSCIALEWLERHDRDRARAPRNVGWISLGVSMAAIIQFGREHDQVEAGVVCAFMPLLAKVLWWLVLRHHSVPLSDGAAHWLRRRREAIGATAALSAQLRRLDAEANSALAAYGADGIGRAAAITLGFGGDVSPVTPPLPPVPPLPPRPSKPVPVAPAPMTFPSHGHGADTMPGQGADMSGHPVPAMSSQLSVPFVAPAPPVSGQLPDVPETAVLDVSGDDVEGTAPRKISAPTIVGTINAALEADAGMSDEELTAHVALVVGDRKNLADTVRRTRAREERKKKAS